MGKWVWYLEFNGPNGLIERSMVIVINSRTKLVSIHTTGHFRGLDGEGISGTVSLLLDKEDMKRLLETLMEVYREAYEEEDIQGD